MTNLIRAVALLLILLPSYASAELEPIHGGRVFFFAADGCGPSPLCSNTGGLDDPWVDLTAAYAHLQANFERKSGIIVFQLKNGIYNGAAMTASGKIQGVVAPSQFVVQGNLVKPEKIVLMPTGTRASFEINYGAQVFIRGLKMDHSNTSQDMILVGQFSSVWVERLEFGYNFNPYNHMTVAFFSYLEVKKGDYKISGSAQCHVLVGNQASVYFETNGGRRADGTFLINADIVADKNGVTPDFLAGFFYAASNSSINGQAVNYRGAATGRKFVVEGNSTIDIGGTSPCQASPGVPTVPGTLPGIRRTGGQLISHPGDFVPAE